MTDPVTGRSCSRSSHRSRADLRDCGMTVVLVKTGRQRGRDVTEPDPALLGDQRASARVADIAARGVFAVLDEDEKHPSRQDAAVTAREQVAATRRSAALAESAAPGPGGRWTVQAVYRRLVDLYRRFTGPRGQA